MKINVHLCPITDNLPNKNYNFNVDNIHQAGRFSENLFLTKTTFFKRQDWCYHSYQLQITTYILRSP